MILAVVYNTQNHNRVSGLGPSSEILNTTFWKLDVFPSSDEGMEIPTLLGPLERVSPDTWTYPVSERLWECLEFRTMDKVQKSSNSEWESEDQRGRALCLNCLAKLSVDYVLPPPPPSPCLMSTIPWIQYYTDSWPPARPIILTE
jgi:hypothetical protein